MKLTLELRDTGEHVEMDLPALPRIGERVQWTDEAEFTRQYEVGMLHWTLVAGAEPFILVQLRAV